MASSALIKVTPSELDQQGNQLKQHADSLKDILTQIDSLIGTITDEWDGLAQDAYYNMYTDMKTNLDKFPELVDSLGEATKAAAEAFSDVDESLQGSFNSAR